MADFLFVFDPDVEMLPGLKRDVNEGLLTDVIRDALDEHHLCVDEAVKEQNGFGFRLIHPNAGMMVDSVHGFTVNGGEPAYFYLVSSTTGIQGNTSHWKTYAMNEAEWQKHIDSARQSPPAFII